MVRCATGVAGAAAIPLLIWLVKYRSNHPRRGLWPRLPSLSKEGSPGAGFRDRNSLSGVQRDQKKHEPIAQQNSSDEQGEPQNLDHPNRAARAVNRSRCTVQIGGASS